MDKFCVVLTAFNGCLHLRITLHCTYRTLFMSLCLTVARRILSSTLAFLMFQEKEEDIKYKP